MDVTSFERYQTVWETMGVLVSWYKRALQPACTICHRRRSGFAIHGGPRQHQAKPAPRRPFHASRGEPSADCPNYCMCYKLPKGQQRIFFE